MTSKKSRKYPDDMPVHILEIQEYVTDALDGLDKVLNALVELEDNKQGIIDFVYTTFYDTLMECLCETYNAVTLITITDGKNNSI